MSEVDINKLVDRFLVWPLPASVCSDLCATQQGAPHRSGTTLLSAVEAKQMLEYLLADMAPPAVWSRETPTEPGWYWWKHGAVKEVAHIKLSPAGHPLMERIGTDQYSPRYYDEGSEWIPLRPPVEGKG